MPITFTIYIILPGVLCCSFSLSDGVGMTEVNVSLSTSQVILEIVLEI